MFCLFVYTYYHLLHTYIVSYIYSSYIVVYLIISQVRFNRSGQYRYAGWTSMTFNLFTVVFNNQIIYLVILIFTIKPFLFYYCNERILISVIHYIFGFDCLQPSLLTFAFYLETRSYAITMDHNINLGILNKICLLFKGPIYVNKKK